MLLSIEGEEKTWKSTLAYTAPLPIVAFDFDMGAERAIYGTKYEYFKDLKIDIRKYLAWNGSKAPDKEIGDADITIFQCPIPIQFDGAKLEKAKELWAFFLDTLVLTAIPNSKVNTVVIDTMTLARRLAHDQHLQKLQENGDPKRPRTGLLQIEYGPVNEPIRNIYNYCKAYEKNIVAVHHLTDDYMDVPDSKGEVKSVMTGKRVLEGLKQTPRIVDVAVRLEKTGSGEVVTKIQTCGYNTSLEGMEIKDADWNKLVSMIDNSVGGRLQLPRRQELGRQA